MKKKILSTIFTVCLTIFAFGAISASAETEGIYTYSVSNGEATIEDCDNSASGDIVIPDQFGEYPVTSIGYYAFQNCSSLTSITIPDSVTSIDYYAFYGCSSLTSVTIPDSVTTIGSSAFRNCSSLTSIIIPNSITSISDNVFRNCSSLTSITIPDRVTSIEHYAFYGCSNLKNVYTDSITDWLNINFSNYSANPLSNGGILYIDNKIATNITVPEGVTSIGSDAFAGYGSLTSITFPYSATSIGSDAFRDCSGLTSVTIGDNVTSISASAFCGCSGLTSVTIGDNVTSIGNSAFRNCSGLTSVTIPDSVTSIDQNAFRDCSSLTSVTIGDSVTKIVSSTFEGCSSLTSVTIGDSVTSIGVSAFRDCSSLTSVIIPKSVTSINQYAFYDCSGLTDVYYTGTEDEWNSIDNITDNSYLTNATKHYNYQETYIISYNANGGSNAPAEQTKTIGKDLTLSATAPIRNGYTFLGWATTSDATAAEYQPNGKFTLDADTTLYAVWKENPYTSTTFTDAGTFKIGTIALHNIEDDCVILISKYKGDVFVSAECRQYTTNSENFVYNTADDIDTIKILVWKSFETLLPITAVEVIPLTNN